MKLLRRCILRIYAAPILNVCSSLTSVYDMRGCREFAWMAK
jgi:hypothetical protein